MTMHRTEPSLDYWIIAAPILFVTLFLFAVLAIKGGDHPRSVQASQLCEDCR